MRGEHGLEDSGLGRRITRPGDGEGRTSSFVPSIRGKNVESISLMADGWKNLRAFSAI